MSCVIEIKALMNYVGPLGQYTRGQTFERPEGMRGSFEAKPQHFKILRTIDLERVALTPPPEGVRRIDLTAKPGFQCPAEEKRLVKWSGNHVVTYAGERVVPGTELIIPKSWLGALLETDGFIQLRGKIAPATEVA